MEGSKRRVTCKDKVISKFGDSVRVAYKNTSSAFLYKNGVISESVFKMDKLAREAVNSAVKSAKITGKPIVTLNQSQEKLTWSIQMAQLKPSARNL